MEVDSNRLFKLQKDHKVLNKYLKYERVWCKNKLKYHPLFGETPDLCLSFSAHSLVWAGLGCLLENNV